MPLGLSDDHRDLASHLRDWARSLASSDLIRAEEEVAHAEFGGSWPEVIKQGLPLIATAEPYGGGGLLDLAVALEAAATHLVPGPLLGTAVAVTVLGRADVDAGVRDAILAAVAAGGSVGLGAGLEAGLEAGPEAGPDSGRAGGGAGVLEVGERLRGTVLSYDGAAASCHLLEGRDGSCWLVPARAVAVQPRRGLDLSRRSAVLTVDLAIDDPGVVRLAGLQGVDVRAVLIALAAAEAAGVASWCLETAVAYAKVREQFGQPIGRFQALKHLMAEMAEQVESITAVAWDAASCDTAGADQRWFATSVAELTAFDAAVQVAQSAIQVLGGIGFTFEHDAHLYLRRATELRALVGDSGTAALALADQAARGVRRRLAVATEEWAGAHETRIRVRADVAEVAAAPDRRTALVDSGFLMPHWPAPYGVGASALEQLVIDEELAAAGVERPDLRIGAWAAPTIAEHGSQAQRERFLRPTLLGEITWCQLFSEPGAGSDLASLSTKAVRVPGGWQLSGQKVWTSLAQQAQWAICLARTNPEAAKHRGITYFLVDMASAGLDIRPLREMTGDALFNEVFLDEVFVPDECVVGEVDGGWALARTTLSNERVAMASARLGTSVERAVELLGDPDAGPGRGGRPVGVAERERVGRAVALATVCAQLGARVTLRRLAGQGPGAESSVAKLLGVRSRQDASELVVELSGRTLLSDPEAVAADVHEMLLTRCLSIAGGTTQVLRSVVGEQVLGLPR